MDIEDMKPGQRKMRGSGGEINKLRRMGRGEYVKGEAIDGKREDSQEMSWKLVV